MATDKWTRRAVTEVMTVVPHGGGSGMFDVYSGSNDEPYVVDLVEGRCSCPDAEYNLDPDERCKHEIRCRIALGIDPCPAELLDERDRCLVNSMEKFGAEPEPEVSVGDAKPARRVATDGGRAKCVECRSFLPDEIDEGTGVYCSDCGHGQHVRTDGGQETDGESEQACARHDIDALPSGYDRCPCCERERHREALIEHELTGDPTLEPW